MCLFPLSRKTTFQVLVCVVFVVCSSIVYGNIEPTKHRVKRKVVFTSSSKFFFRLNGKLNTINYTEIFACGYTIRINYDLPSTIQKRYKFFKRDIHSEIARIPNESTVQGFSCVLKYLCDILSRIYLSQSCGFLCGIGSIIAREEGTEGNFFKNFVTKCQQYETLCPHNDEDISKFSFG